MSRTPTYESWAAMRARVKRKDKKHQCYSGLEVCKRWDYFKNFLEDMGERPVGKTIDRIDSTKGYFKENCRWSTLSVQAKNARTTSGSGYRGVYEIKKDGLLKRWRASISVDGRDVYLGTFYSKEEAYEKYKKIHLEKFPDIKLY